MTDEQIAALAGILKSHQRFLLVPHDRPDGDALGSMLALAEAIDHARKESHVILLGPLGKRYEFLFEHAAPPILGEGMTADRLPQVDVVIVIDTSALRQLTAIAPWLQRFPGVVAAIDHHERGDLRCAAALIDEQAPATGLLVGKLLEHLAWLRGPTIAEHLLVAIGTDTGWFSYNNVTPECFLWAGKLAAMGAPLHGTYEKLFLSETPPRFKLMGRALRSAELLADGAAVVLTLTRADFIETGATQCQTENLIDQASRLKTMQVAVMFVECEDQVVRVSLRGRDPFNVHEFARLFGGGGHRQAAGIKLKGTLEAVKSQVVNRLMNVLAAK